MDLGEARVGKQRTLAVGPPRRGHIALHGVGGEEENVSVSTGGEDHGVRAVRFEGAGAKVTGDDPRRLAIDGNHIDHLGAVVQLDGAEMDLLGQGLIGAKQQLLAGLPFGVKRAADLGAAEGTVIQQAAVFASKRYALSHTLVDDVNAHLGQAMDVGLARTKVSALQRVIKQPMHGVTVAVIILGRVDATLGGDRVGSTRRVVKGKDLYVVSKPGKGGGGGGTGQTGTHDDDVELPFVRRVHQLHRKLVVIPLFGDGAVGYFGIEFDRAHIVSLSSC